MKEIKKFGGYISFLLGAIAIVLMFVKPGLYFADKITEINLYANYNTFNTIFGVEHVFDFNVLGLVALIALALGLLARYGVPLLISGILVLVAAFIDLVVGLTNLKWNLSLKKL